jgi:hypothetical protein
MMGKPMEPLRLKDLLIILKKKGERQMVWDNEERIGWYEKQENLENHHSKNEIPEDK